MAGNGAHTPLHSFLHSHNAVKFQPWFEFSLERKHGYLMRIVADPAMGAVMQPHREITQAVTEGVTPALWSQHCSFPDHPFLSSRDKQHQRSSKMPFYQKCPSRPSHPIPSQHHSDRHPAHTVTEQAHHCSLHFSVSSGFLCESSSGYSK